MATSSESISMRPRAYVSSQLGFSETGRFVLKGLIHPTLEKAGVDVLDPFASCEKLIDFEEISRIEEEGTAQEYKQFWREFNVKVTPTNNSLIELSDCMAIILDGGHAADDGASSELGFIAGKYPDKPVFALRTDLRAADNPATPINAQLLGYITQEGRPGGLYTSVEEWGSAIGYWAKTVFAPADVSAPLLQETE